MGAGADGREAAPAAVLPPRRVLHLDMDAFYAAVEQLDRPGLRGRPVLVGSDRPRGVVATASYEARPFGCRSAQPMAVARRLCPDAVVVPPRMERYAELSERVFAILHGVSPLVEPLGIDEAFLEATGTERLHGPAERLARTLKDRVRESTGLTASVGVAPNKFLAKLASEMEKPDGLTVIDEGSVDRVLLPLPVDRMWGVGPATAERMRALGLGTFADVRAFGEDRLARSFGAAGPHWHRLSRGIDDRPVVPDREAKSVGQEETFEVDLEEPGEARFVLLAQSDEVARRLRRHGLLARGVTVKIRTGDFTTVTRSATLEGPTDLGEHLRRAAARLFDAWTSRSWRPVRLVGVAATRLAPAAGQGALFAVPADERLRRLEHALDDVREKFGPGVLRRGGPPA